MTTLSFCLSFYRIYFASDVLHQCSVLFILGKRAKVTHPWNDVHHEVTHPSACGVISWRLLFFPQSWNIKRIKIVRWKIWHQTPKGLFLAQHLYWNLFLLDNVISRQLQRHVVHSMHYSHTINKQTFKQTISQSTKQWHVHRPMKT